MTVHHPSLMHFGAVQLISPDGSHVIPDALWPELAVAVLLEPEPELLAQWVRELEQELGVNAAHRRALATSTEEVRGAIRADQIARGLVICDQAPVTLPDAERGRGEADVERFDKARAELTSPRLTLTKEQRDVRARTLGSIEAAPHLEADKAWRATTADETADLAKLRGEEVERAPSGGVRVNSRDPLLSLLRAGKLTADQFDAGVVCRDFYEARTSGLGSQMGGLGGVSSPTFDNSGAVLAGIQRATALQKIGNIESGVLTGAYRLKDATPRTIECWARFKIEAVETHVALAMLRVVCSEGKSLSSQGEGRAFEPNATALALALDVAFAVIRGKD